MSWLTTIRRMLRRYVAKEGEEADKPVSSPQPKLPLVEIRYNLLIPDPKVPPFPSNADKGPYVLYQYIQLMVSDPSHITVPVGIVGKHRSDECSICNDINLYNLGLIYDRMPATNQLFINLTRNQDRRIWLEEDNYAPSPLQRMPDYSDKRMLVFEGTRICTGDVLIRREKEFIVITKHTFQTHALLHTSFVK